MTAMKHMGKVLGQKLPATDGEDAAAFVQDFAVSTDTDTDKPITAGLFRLEAGKALTYTYTYHEMKLIVDGEFEIADESEQKVKASKGDMFYSRREARLPSRRLALASASSADSAAKARLDFTAGAHQ